MRTVLKILLFPVVMVVDLFVWIFCGLLSCSAFVFSLASSIVSILAVAVLLAYSVKKRLDPVGNCIPCKPHGTTPARNKNGW